MYWLALIFICGTLAPNSSAEDTILVSQGSSDEKSPLSREILVLDSVIKRLKDQKEDLSFKNYEGARIDQIIPDDIFSLDADHHQLSRNSSITRPRRRRQVLSGCGYYPCPQQPPPCPYGQLCPNAPVPYPVPPPYIPVPQPAPPPTFIPPPYQPPQPPTPSYYIPTFPPPAPPQPTYIPQPPVPYPRPTYQPQPQPTYIPQPPPVPYPRPTYPPRPQPTYIPQPPVPYPRPTVPPRPPPTVPPESTCPPVNPNTPDKLENLKIFLSQAGNCRNTGCNNRCARPRREKCTIDYDTLLMRLTFIEEKLRDLEKIEARLKISIVILQSIKKDPRFPGTEGETGAPGVKGARGSKGPTGYPGVNGICVTRASQNPPPGPRGPPGNKGDPGYPGDKLCNCDGVRGDDGDPGDSLTGPPGARGVKGSKGARGPIIHYRKIQ